MRKRVRRCAREGVPAERACRERGLLLLTASVFETLRFIPPLTVSATEIDQALAVVADALREVAAA